MFPGLPPNWGQMTPEERALLIDTLRARLDEILVLGARVETLISILEMPGASEALVDLGWETLSNEVETINRPKIWN